MDKKLSNDLGCIITDFAVEIGFKAKKKKFNKVHEKTVKRILKVVKK